MNTLDFNARITKFFLNNNRLTILLLILVVLLGAVSLAGLKTTGFPSPQVNVLLVRTIYPGASSETVKDDLTIPLEEQIKSLPEIESYTSTSLESASIIAATISTGTDINDAKSALNAALSEASIPDDATSPTISEIDISDPDYTIAIIEDSEKKLFEVSTKFIESIQELSNTDSANLQVKVERFIEIKLNNSKLENKGISISSIKSQLSSIGESIPVDTNLEINKVNNSLSTSVSGVSLKTIRNLKVTGTTFNRFGRPTTKNYNLSEVATFSVTYKFENKNPTWVTYRDNAGESQIAKAAVLNIRSIPGVDSTEYNKELTQIASDSLGLNYFKLGESIFGNPQDGLLIEMASAESDNQEQVDEVVGGLIGGALDIDNELLAQVGWLLGGIQLVFFVMILFVSLRAAIVAAVSIPLSLIFSVIYLYAFGYELNTLVLFSLVLVIGLVVDPALVALESIQRKIDSGLKGKEAAIAGIKDVGSGLFLAALTNVIVFLPFGVISGILGQIFQYIPLTIIPAIIGSYIVPLVFLVWFGSKFLTRTKNKKANEEANLWPVAKSLISINNKILNSHWAIQVGIILIALIVPIGITGALVGSGKVVFTQFSGGDNGESLQIKGEYLAEIPLDKQQSIKQSIIRSISKLDGVGTVYPLSSSLNYIVLPENESVNLLELDKFIELELDEYRDSFFTVNSGIVSFTPPAEEYQIVLAVKEDNKDILRNASISVGTNIETLCKEADQVIFNPDCLEENQIVQKVDDGFTGKESTSIEVILNRKKLADNNFIVNGAPQSILVNQRLRELFNTDSETAVTTAIVGGEEIDVVITNSLKAPKTIQAIRNTKITNLVGKKIKISKIGSVVKKKSSSSITRINGETTNLVRVQLTEEYSDQTSAASIGEAILDHYNLENSDNTSDLGLKKGSIGTYSEGGTSGFQKSFTELISALVIAIFLTYLVLVVFFESFSQPLVILFTIPLTFIGVFPALAFLGTGELGFLEIIGLIILVGIVENVAIFLIDAAKQKIKEEGWSDKKAIAYASGIRFRPVILTTVTSIMSLTPLAFTSDLYRPISLVIIFGLISSGVTSLFTTPILFVFFRNLSRKIRGDSGIGE